jgi:hypothetical protein
VHAGLNVGGDADWIDLTPREFQGGLQGQPRVLGPQIDELTTTQIAAMQVAHEATDQAKDIIARRPAAQHENLRQKPRKIHRIDGGPARRGIAQTASLPVVDQDFSTRIRHGLSPNS